MQARAERDQAQAELKRSRADGLPTVSLGASGGADLADPFSRRAEYNFGINISAPLYSGGARRARTRGAAYALSAADAAEARVRNEVGRQPAEAGGSEGDTSELRLLMRNPYAVFFLETKQTKSHS